MKRITGGLIQRVGHRLFVIVACVGCLVGQRQLPEEVKYEGDITEDAEGRSGWYRDRR